MKQIKLLTMFVMFFLVATTAFAGSWSGRVVLQTTTTGIDTVTVDAIMAGSVVGSDLTNSTGHFTVTGLSDGSYTLRFTKAGYVQKNISGLPAINNSNPLRTNITWPFNIEMTQSLPGSVTGTITNTTSALSGATVRLLQGVSVIATTSTSGIGAYSFTNVIDGTYTVEASAAGYVTQQASNVLVQPNSTTSNVNFILLQGLGISSGPSVSGISTSSATVSWTTTVASNTSVNYGTTVALGTRANTNNAVTSHSQSLTGLSPSTTYFYAVTSCSGSCVTSSTLSFTTSAPSSGGGSGGGGGGSGSSSTTANDIILTNQLLSTLNIKWDIAKNPFVKTIRPIDTIIFVYDGTSYNIMVDKFNSKTGVIGFRIAPTDEVASGYKNDEFRFNIKDKYLIITPQEITYDTKIESRSAIKLRLFLTDKPKGEDKGPTVVQKVKNGVIKVMGEIVPPKVASVPVGVGISVATVLIGLLLFLGIKKVFV